MNNVPDNYNFSVKATQQDNQTQKGSNKAIGVLIAISASVGGVLVALLILYLIYLKKK